MRKRRIRYGGKSQLLPPKGVTQSSKVRSTFAHMRHLMTFGNHKGERCGYNIITYLQVTERKDGLFKVQIQHGPDKHQTHGLSFTSTDNPSQHFTIGMSVFSLAARCSGPTGFIREEEEAWPSTN